MGIGEWIVLVVFGLVVPIGVLYRVAGARGQSSRYALWGLLSYVGLVIGLLVLIAMPKAERTDSF